MVGVIRDRAEDDLKIVLNKFGESINESSDLNEQFWNAFEKKQKKDCHPGFTKRNAKLIASHYGKHMRPTPFQTKINYTNPVKVFDFQVLANLFEKFPEIVSVTVREQVDNTCLHLLAPACTCLTFSKM